MQGLSLWTYATLIFAHPQITKYHVNIYMYYIRKCTTLGSQVVEALSRPSAMVHNSLNGTYMIEKIQQENGSISTLHAACPAVQRVRCTANWLTPLLAYFSLWQHVQVRTAKGVSATTCTAGDGLMLGQVLV